MAWGENDGVFSERVGLGLEEGDLYFNADKRFAIFSIQGHTVIDENTLQRLGLDKVFGCPSARKLLTQVLERYKSDYVVLQRLEFILLALFSMPVADYQEQKYYMFDTVLFKWEEIQESA